MPVLSLQFSRVAGVLVIGAISISLVSQVVFGPEPGTRTEPYRVNQPPEVHAATGDQTVFFRWPPLTNMPMRSGTEANVPDDCEVIGLLADGRPRAYVTKFLEYPDHVFNDRVGDTSLTVTYCEKTSCARVFHRTDDIEVMLGGWSGKEMMLFVDGAYWDHSSREIPLAEYGFIRTTWGRWRACYPESDVYAGDGGTRRAWFGEGPVPHEDEFSG